MTAKKKTEAPSAIAVFAEALRLGLTSFGGPAAHIGYFERAYVRAKKWLTPEEFAGFFAVCQALPGPVSSQLGFLIGYHRAGWAGALAAWLGFTLPSALLMFAFAHFSPGLRGTGGAWFDAVLHGFKLAAVAVVAQAAWGMARRHCPDTPRGALALGAFALALLVGGAAAQLTALALGAAGGLLWGQGDKYPPSPPQKHARAGALIALAVFAALFLALPAAATWAPFPDMPVVRNLSPPPNSLTKLLAVLYRAGTLVFGGGHVVLPLLRDALVPAGFLSDDTFLAGYGFAQAMPGPLFSFSAYIGASVAPEGLAAPWAVLSVIFLFLPGLLLAVPGLLLWKKFRSAPAAGAALSGLNAAVTGLLGAALYSPVFTSAVHSGADAAIAATGLFLLERGVLPPIAVVALCTALSTVSVWLMPTR